MSIAKKIINRLRNFTRQLKAEDVARTRSFDALNCRGRMFTFKERTTADVRYDNGMVIVELEEIGVSGIGGTLRDAMEDFIEEFAATWDGVANEPDANLTPDGRYLKKLLWRYVRSVYTP